MGYDRYTRNDRDDWRRSDDGGDYGRSQGYSADHGRSSARDYAAAGQYGGYRDSWQNRDAGRSSDPWRSGDDYGSRAPRGERGYGAQTGWDRDGDRSYRTSRDSWDGYRSSGRERSNYDRRPEGYSYQDRDFFSRAGDEVRSWFGDEDAERRREQDARQDAQRERDDHYHGWRSRQMADFDRDYDEYRRENATKFDNEFGNWRTERQGQRSSLSRVSEHMDVVGSDGQHVGTVDKVRGDRIILTKNDADAGGHHHSIPSRWIESVDDKVMIRKTADEAKSAWKDEERSGALFGEQDDRSRTGYSRTRFSGTY